MKKYTPKTRVLASLRFEEADRVPLDIGGINNTTMHVSVEKRLKEYLGINGHESQMKAFNQQVVIPDERILHHFGADTRTIYISDRIAWNEFILSLVLTNRYTRTLPVAVSLYLTDHGIEWGQITTIATIIAIPAFIFTFTAAKSLIMGLTAGAVKG